MSSPADPAGELITRPEVFENVWELLRDPTHKQTLALVCKVLHECVHSNIRTVHLRSERASDRRWWPGLADKVRKLEVCLGACQASASLVETLLERAPYSNITDLIVSGTMRHSHYAARNRPTRVPFRIQSTVVRVELRWCSLDQDAFASLVRCPNLRGLVVRDCGVALPPFSEEVQASTAAVCSTLASLTQLRDLSLILNKAPPSLLQALAGMSALTSLHVRDHQNGPGPLPILGSSPNLRDMSLEGMHVLPSAAHEGLPDVLSRLTALERLALPFQYDILPPRCVRALAGLTGLKSLKALLRDERTEAAQEACPVLPLRALTALHLTRPACVLTLGAMLEGVTGIRKVISGDTHGDYEFEGLNFLVPDPGAASLHRVQKAAALAAEALKGARHQQVHFDGIDDEVYDDKDFRELSPELVTALLRPINQGHVTALKLDHLVLTQAASEALVECLPELRTVQLYFVRVRDGALLPFGRLARIRELSMDNGDWCDYDHEEDDQQYMGWWNVMEYCSECEQRDSSPHTLRCSRVLRERFYQICKGSARRRGLTRVKLE